MEYIDKVRDVAANAIIDEYLGKVPRPGAYCKRKLYDGFSSTVGRNELIDKVLLPEQDHRCCYCMKSIPEHQYGTIEHIIPVAAKKSDMPHYFHPEFKGLNALNVCHTSDFISCGKKVPQYPHEVAYHNFSFACRTCNSTRGNKKIDTIFLYPGIHKQVDYNVTTGEMTWLVDPVFTNPNSLELPTVEKVGLNAPLLKAIRAVWFYGKNHPQAEYSTPDTVNTLAQRAELVFNTFGAALLSQSANFTIDDLNAYLSLTKDFIWQKVLEYSYFGK